MTTDALTALLLDPFLTTGEAEREFGAMRYRRDGSATESPANPRQHHSHEGVKATNREGVVSPFARRVGWSSPRAGERRT